MRWTTAINFFFRRLLVTPLPLLLVLLGTLEILRKFEGSCLREQS